MKHGFNKGDDLIKAMSQQVSNVIGDLDVKLDRVLRKQEHDYLNAYSIYVCQKEGDLRQLISKLTDQNSQSVKDEIISNLKLAIKRQQDELVARDKTFVKLNETIKAVTDRSNGFQEEKNFL